MSRREMRNNPNVSGNPAFQEASAGFGEHMTSMRPGAGVPTQQREAPGKTFETKGIDDYSTLINPLTKRPFKNTAISKMFPDEMWTAVAKGLFDLLMERRNRGR